MEKCPSLSLPPFFPPPSTPISPSLYIIIKVNYISINKPDRCYHLTFLPGKQNGLLRFVRIGVGVVGRERAACQVIETLLALILLPRTKPSYCLIEPLKAGLIGIVLIFSRPQTRGNSLGPLREKQKKKIVYSAKIKAILCFSSQCLISGWHLYVSSLQGHLLALSAWAPTLSFRLIGGYA